MDTNISAWVHAFLKSLGKRLTKYNSHTTATILRFLRAQF